jgi:single-strand DNA-binding protein
MTHYLIQKRFDKLQLLTWAKLAENCNNLGHKGRGVRVVGRLKQERWNGSDGKAHSRVAIVAEHVEFRPEFKKGDIVGTTENSEASVTELLAEKALDTEQETREYVPEAELEPIAF